MNGRLPPPTLASLLAEGWREISQLDSRAWKTARGLLAPGAMARSWVEGDRTSTFPPIRVYLLASALYFLAGGDPFLSALVQADLLSLLPDGSLSGFSEPALRNAIEGQVMGWVAVIRFFTLLPIGIFLALASRREAPRLAPALVLAMHVFTVSFLLATVANGVVLLLDLSADDPRWPRFAVSYLVVERATVALWLITGIRTLWRRSWMIAAGAGFAAVLLDLLFLVLSFAIASGAMEARIQGV